MALFQKSVLNKFIKSQDTVKIEAAYQRFSDNFQKAERQAEIRSMKEEEYQDGFLDDLFVNILGYCVVLFLCYFCCIIKWLRKFVI